RGIIMRLQIPSEDLQGFPSVFLSLLVRRLRALSNGGKELVGLQPILVVVLHVSDIFEFEYGEPSAGVRREQDAQLISRDGVLRALHEFCRSLLSRERIARGNLDRRPASQRS